jgi:hypothetical protein
MDKALRYAPAALLAIGLLASTPACATTAYGPGYRYGGYGYEDRDHNRDVARIAYDHGFHEGLEAGENDGLNGRRFEPSRHGDWRDGDEGYHRNYGDREFYRQSFRNGFEAGYLQAYSRYAGYRRW